MAEEGIKIEGEAEESSQSPKVSEQQEEARKESARKQGWRPRKEWDGPAEDWVPAREFLGRQKLFDKIHDLKNNMTRQAQRFEQDMGRITTHFAQVREVEYQKAKKELQQDLRAAKAADDVEAVADIAGQIKEVENQEKVAQVEAKQVQRQQTNQGTSPEFETWQRTNSGWWQKDSDMTSEAIRLGTGYAATNPNASQKEVLDHVDSRIKKLYPEKFSTGEKRVDESRVESGSGTARSSPKKGKLTVGDLDDMEKSVMNTLVKRGALKEIAAKNKRSQQEEYLVQLAERKSA